MIAYRAETAMVMIFAGEKWPRPDDARSLAREIFHLGSGFDS